MILHADTVEIIWTLVAIAGVILALDALEQALGDYHLIRGNRQSADREQRLEYSIVRGDVVSAAWIVAIEVLEAAVGVLAMLTPAPPRGRTNLGWAIVALLMLAALGLPIRLYDQRRRRRRLLHD